MKVIKKKQGFTFTPAILILIVLMMSGIAFLAYVFNTGKFALKVESSTVAKYAAETGLNHFRAQLAGLSSYDSTLNKYVNNWFNAKESNNGSCKYLFTSSAGCTESLRNPSNTTRMSNLIPVYEKTNESTSKVIGKYRLILEDGSLLTSSKTATGSPTSGLDKYNNKIWSDATNKNYFLTNKTFRFGVKAEGFSADQLDSSGNPKSNATPQSIYGVIEAPVNSKTVLPEDWGTGAPSQFLLSSDGGNSADPTDRLSLFSNQIITGPIHTNKDFNFYWRGDFRVSENLTNITKNNSFEVSVKKGAYDYDTYPLSVSRVVRLQGQPPTQITIFAQGFEANNSLNKVSIDGSAWVNPVSTTQINTPSPQQLNLRLIKMVVNLPYTPTPTSSYRIDLGTSLASLSYYIDEKDIYTVPASWKPTKKNLEGKSFWQYGNGLSEALGIMQIRYGSSTYSPFGDYTGDNIIDGEYFFCKPGYTYNPFSLLTNDGLQPFLVWGNGSLRWGTPKSRPPKDGEYQVTYLTPYNYPHKKTYVFDQLSYSNTTNLDDTDTNKSFYIHSHKAPGAGMPLYADTHGHYDYPFGMEGVYLEPANTTNYIGSATWSNDHVHRLQGLDISTKGTSLEDNYFFYWKEQNFKPSKKTEKIAPILYPTNFNFNQQREYANTILNMILGKSLEKDSGGNYKPLTTIPEDRENGYYNANGGIIDFRATYFGNDLKYSDGTPVLPAGSKITDTAIIYVNDKQYQSNDPRIPNPYYLQIAKTKLSPDFKAYTYRQIPKNAPVLLKSSDSSKTGKTIEGGIIFVNRGVVRIGGLGHHKGNVQLGYVGLNSFGNNTIIDGRLTIISYSEEKPISYIDNTTSSTTDNTGDIVITGNIIYKNKVYNNREQMTYRYDEYSDLAYDHDGFRQYTAATQNKFDPDAPLDANKTLPLSINDTPSRVDWITDVDGTPTNLERADGEKVDSLALISSNDIKIPVMQYYQDSNETVFNDNDNDGKTDYPDTSNLPSSALNKYPVPYIPLKHDILTIHGQLIAGHKITQTKAGTNNEATSKNDQLIMYGSFYSYAPPNLSYFDRQSNLKYEESMGRIYMYDKTLNTVPLAGVPYFPKDTNYNENSNYVAGLDFPRILPGTWQVVTGNK